MLPDRVSNPGPLTYESGVLPIALRGPVKIDDSKWGRKQKYHIGRAAAYSQCIFGPIERGIGRVVLLTVKTRKASELILKNN